MKPLMIVTAIVFSLLCNYAKAGRDYCYSEDRYYPGFATMTPYRTVRPKSMKFENIIPKGCTPKHVWHLIRHGSHEPHETDMRRMGRHLPSLQKNIVHAYRRKKGKLCKKDVRSMSRWKIRNIPKKGLGKEGEDEIRSIAARFRDTFPDLLKDSSFRERPGTRMKLATANDIQNLDSASVYIKERFGSYSRYVKRPSKFPNGLQFYELCAKYVTEVYNKRKEEKPVYKFMKGKHMEKLLEQISDRLGFKVTIREVRTMYNTCRYFNAWHPKYLSAWCGAFTPEHLKVLEYWEDLRTYTEHGYGHMINYKQACTLGEDLLDQFRARVEKGTDKIRSTIYFANSEAIMSFIAYLGLFKDKDPLTEDSIPKSRLWRTSKFATYGSNLAFFLSSCEKDKWKVSAVLNEKPLLLPGCKTALGCSWKKFLKHYDYLDDCDLKKICGFMSATYSKTKQRHAHYKLDDLM